LFFNSPKTKKDRVVYHIGRIFVFRGDVDLNSAVQVKFTLPEMNKLAKEAISDTIDLLFLSAATGMYVLL